MANPLAILAGLTTVGAGAATGAMEGDIAGEGLRRRFQSEDVQNQLRMLESIRKGQEIQQAQTPEEVIHGGIKYRRDPRTGSLTSLGPVEQPAMNPLQQSTIDLHRAQTQNVGQPAPLDAKTGAALEEWRKNPANQGKSLMDFHKEFTTATHPQAASHLNIGRITDAQGNVRERIIGPDGTVIAERNLGQIGKPMRSATDRETTSTTERLVPRALITNPDTMTELRAAVPTLVAELGKLPGFSAPGPTVTLPTGQKVSKESIIERAFLKRYGIEVKVARTSTAGWFGGAATESYKIVSAWKPEQRLPVETTRTTGPVRGARPSPSDEEE